MQAGWPIFAIGLLIGGFAEKRYRSQNIGTLINRSQS
jgi:hypothetical protein